MNTEAEKIVPLVKSDDGGMTIAPDQDLLRQQVRMIMQEEGESQNAIAKDANLKASTLSQWMNGKYPGNSAPIVMAIVNWLNARASRKQFQSVMPPAPDYIEAPTARRIYDALQYAQLAGDIAVIYGGAGLGKTTTIRRYREKNPNVSVVTATPATASVGVLLEEIAISMGLRDFPLHAARLQRAIIAQIRDRGGLLIIDEAQHLTKQSLEACRSLHDATQVGLAFAGNAAVYNNMFRGGNNGFAQLFSRVGKRVPLARAVPLDVRAVASAFAVAGKEELKVLEEISRQPGALRAVVKALRLAAMHAKGGAIDKAAIGTAWRELQGNESLAEQLHA